MYRIFIIEDDRTIANAVKNHLEKWGFEARCAENFKDIMTEFSEFSPHLVLMDIGLPFYNGFYHCTEIRKVSKVPVVFLSSASDNMNIVMAMNMGVDDFIAKPFDLTVLMARSRRYFAEHTISARKQISSPTKAQCSTYPMQLSASTVKK